MRNGDRLHEIYRGRWYFAVIICMLAVLNPLYVQAATEKITLLQDHYYGAYDDNGRDSSYHYLYPNDEYRDYKKFMKFTYKISDDSVIGLRFNGNVDFDHGILDIDEKGKQRIIAPNDVKVHALGPGTATLKVYDGKKLIDSYSFTVVSDIMYSPSSFVNTGGEYRSDKELEKESKLVKKLIKTATGAKYTSTNQRIVAALNENIAYGGKLMSDKEYDKLYKKYREELGYRYISAYSRLIDKKATAQGYAEVNKLMLINMGLRCEVYAYSPGTAYNYLKLYNRNKDYEKEIKERDEFYRLYDKNYDTNKLHGGLDEGYMYTVEKGSFQDIEFSAITKLESDYDFSMDDKDNIYNRTHLPAWIIGEDTSQKIVNVGQTVRLSSSDMNNNIFSSDTSIVKVENGEITGVKPGIAIVYRYNDFYCDVFYVMVKKKSSARTIKGKVYSKSVKSYFTDSDFAPYIYGGQRKRDQIDAWESLRLYELEPIFGYGGILKTEYSKGSLDCYLEYEGDRQLLCSIGTSIYAD